MKEAHCNALTQEVILTSNVPLIKTDLIDSPSSDDLDRDERGELEGRRICYIPEDFIGLAIELSMLKQHDLQGGTQASVNFTHQAEEIIIG